MGCASRDGEPPFGPTHGDDSVCSDLRGPSQNRRSVGIGLSLKHSPPVKAHPAFYWPLTRCVGPSTLVDSFPALSPGARYVSGVSLSTSTGRCQSVNILYIPEDTTGSTSKMPRSESMGSVIVLVRSWISRSATRHVRLYH